MEKKILMLEKYVKIQFGKRAFYLPRIPANICYENNNTISIDFADMDEYVIVDGIRCYYCVIYHADNDTVDTHLKDFTIDGMVCTQPYPFSLNRPKGWQQPAEEGRICRERKENACQIMKKNI